MFRRSNVRFEGKHCTMNLLKEHVCQAIEDELQNEVKDFDVSDDDYLEISTRLWERFYSCCEQYHMKASQPSGLLILEPLDGVCVVKKNTFSLLRPCETIEHLMLAGEDVEENIVVSLYFPDNERQGRDLVNLVEVLAQIEKWLPEDIKIDLDRKLYQLEMPNVLIEKLTNELLAGDTEKELLPPNFLVAIRQKLQSIKNLREAISMLLDILRMDNGYPETMHTNFTNLNHNTRMFMSLGALFGSQVGLTLLSETVRQNSLIRFAICRNLLLLQQILIDTHSLPVDTLECLRSQFMPDVLIFLQSYHVMVWISETPVNINSAASMETSMQRLNLLQLTSGSGRIYSTGGKCNSAPLLQVFLSAKGLYTALALYADNIKIVENVSLQQTLMPLSTIVSQLIWPVSFNFIFGEWLFSTCQHIIIADYVRLLSETVRQNSLIRFAICRNLLLLQQILIDTHSLPVDTLECLRSQFMPDVLIFLQSYHVMVWISETPVNINSAASMETSMQRLNLLQLTSGSGRIYSTGGKCNSAPLLQVFLSAKGLYTALALYADNIKIVENVSLQQTLMPLSTIVSQLIWPVSFNFIFGEWLFSTCQHIITADYVRLLNSWCEWNICSRQFILAVTLLDSGESCKAYDLFLQSAKGVVKEHFLSEKILKNSPYATLSEKLSEIEIDKNQLKVTHQCIAQYYLKVIQLFEQHNALDHIISMAQVAIGLLDKNDPQLPMFQSIVFNNHLQLEHYEEAYHSLIYNAELSRRKDCLRQLVITLFNRKRYDLLMHFPYVGLHEEFENIVESRARSQTMDKNEIYDFLYSFHVNNGNMRKGRFNINLH